jgi:hypothetical protein
MIPISSTCMLVNYEVSLKLSVGTKLSRIDNFVMVDVANIVSISYFQLGVQQEIITISLIDG